MRALITGAASGIGRAVAHRFTADGAARGVPAALFLVDLNADALDHVGNELNALGATCHVLAADLSLPISAQQAVDGAAKALGGLDALISNAGILIQGTRLIDMTLADYDRLFAVNTRATWLLAQHARRLLAASRGSIVATVSVSAHAPTPTLGNYSATKAALAMLVQQLAYELGPEGVRCNCVSPGSTRTGINDWLLSDANVRAAREAALPLGRIGRPEDIAAAIAFLAGPDAAYITGADLVVDGGLNTLLMPGLASLGAPKA